jgi:hypothetical protein
MFPLPLLPPSLSSPFLLLPHSALLSPNKPDAASEIVLVHTVSAAHTPESVHSQLAVSLAFLVYLFSFSYCYAA